MIYYLFDYIYFFIGHKNVQVGFGSCRPPGSGSGSQDYGSTDPGQKEIFTDLQHCFFPNVNSKMAWQQVTN
jgi:hypothetical protein